MVLIVLTYGLYVVAKYSNGVMTVNNGYAEAAVTAIYDGRTTALDKAPYLEAADEVAIQLTGDNAAEIAAALKVSAAATTTFFLSRFSDDAILPIVVVLPTPLTPIIKITVISLLKYC